MNFKKIITLLLAFTLTLSLALRRHERKARRDPR